jgi:hypothetical protein
MLSRPQLRQSALAALFMVVLSYNACSPFSALNNSLSSSSLSLQDTSTKACSVTHPGASVLRRLSRLEYKYSVQDIFGITSDPTTGFPIDQTGTDNFATTMSPERMQAFVDAAESTVGAAFTAKSPLLTCANKQAPETCPDEILLKIASKAWRRPVSAGEIADLKGVIVSARASIDAIAGYTGNKALDALSVAVQAIFVSPRFLFIVNPVSSSGSLDQYAFISRLSYFLWSSIPDDELLNLASAGKFSDRPTLVSQVKRMLADKRSSRFAQTFADRWLTLWNLSNGNSTDDFHQSLITETEMFFESIMRSDLSVSQLMEAEYTFVNATLASNYGIAGVSGASFQKVLTSANGRKGLLSQGSLLVMNSDTLHSKPTARGHFILSNITCTPPPPFPDGVGITTLRGDDPNMTIRTKLAAHRQGACAGCHVQMDSIGLGLEKFDQFGKWRDNYVVPVAPVDASGDLYGTHFVDHRDLATVIVDNKDFGKCVSRKMLSYAAGRSVASVSDDRCMYEEIAHVSTDRNSEFSDLILAIVTSDAFLRNESN